MNVSCKLCFKVWTSIDKFITKVKLCFKLLFKWIRRGKFQFNLLFFTFKTPQVLEGEKIASFKSNSRCEEVGKAKKQIPSPSTIPSLPPLMKLIFSQAAAADSCLDSWLHDTECCCQNTAVRWSFLAYKRFRLSLSKNQEHVPETYALTLFTVKLSVKKCKLYLTYHE